MKKENELQGRKTGKFKLKMTFAILVLTALAIVELYLMMNYQMEYLYLGAVGLVILCFVYWAVDISFQMQEQKDAFHEKEYENLYKAEKVSYISMKQSFLDIEKILKDIEDLPVDDVIQSQKAIGKVTIRRNKENMQTIIDSQKELKERMDAFENMLNELNGISDCQQAILDTIQKLETSVKEGVSSAVASASDIQNIQMAQESAFVEEEEQALSEEPSAAEVPTEEQITDTEPPSSETSSVSEVEQLSEEPSVVEEQVEEASTVEAFEEETIPEELTVSGESEAEEATKTEEPAVEEGPVLPEEVVAEDQKMSEITEESPNEIPTMPDLSDPGHVMTPEEIAALLANM